jgi:hypothetical protein
MKTLLALLTMLAMTCHAQTIPAIKGHKLGESLQEFVSHSNATTKRLVQWCGAHDSPMCNGVADVLATPDEVWEGQVDVDCDPVIESMLSAYPKSMLNSSGFSVPTEATAKSWCAEDLISMTFEEGKLVRIQAEIWSSWSESYGDLLKKFGKPTSFQTKVLQNGFGATFRTSASFWVTKSYNARAEELLSDDLTRYVSLEVLTPSYAHVRAQELKKSQKNALD